MKENAEEAKLKKRMDDLHKEIGVMKNNFRLTDINLDYMQKELLTRDFMSKYTKYSTFDELIESGNFTIENEIQFKVLTDTSQWNKHISENTSFKDWNEMLRTAVLERATRKLKG